MSKCLRIIALFFSLAVTLSSLGIVTPVAFAGVAIRCPCDFFQVPFDESCWRPDTLDPQFRPQGPGEFCLLRNGFVGTDDRLQMFTNRNEENLCQIFGQAPALPAQCQFLVTAPPLTPAEAEACKTELEAYATALNLELGIRVLGGPPYECMPTPQIPTLNEWGKIVTIVVIAVFAVIGIIVMRLRDTVKSD